MTTGNKPTGTLERHHLSKPHSNMSVWVANWSGCRIKSQNKDPDLKIQTPKLQLLHAPSPPRRRYRKGTWPSLASCCDLPSWTPLPLLALESLLPLTVFCSGLACLASLSCTVVSSSGFRCVKTERGGRGTGRKTQTELWHKVGRKKESMRRINRASRRRSCTGTHKRHESTQWGTWWHTAASWRLPATDAHKHPGLFRQTHGHTHDWCEKSHGGGAIGWRKQNKVKRNTMEASEDSPSSSQGGRCQWELLKMRWFQVTGSSSGGG